MAAPIVCCELGNLYNKEALLTAILDKTLPDALSHIRGLKDIRTLEFTEYPRPSEYEGVSLQSEHVPLFICPVTRQEFNGIHPFYCIWSTGKVLSDNAIKEMGIDALQSEYGPFSSVDLVRLLPGEHEMDEQRSNMHRRRELAHNMKKGKKERKERYGDNESAFFESNISGKKRMTEDTSRNSRMLKLTTTESVVSSASSTLKDMETKSDVFKSLFHKDTEKEKKDRDLFMNVAGIRYTL